MKVYCGECEYFRAFSWAQHSKEECMHPENRVEKKLAENYRRPESSYITSAVEPYKRNEHNDCSLFSPLPEIPN